MTTRSACYTLSARSWQKLLATLKALSIPDSSYNPIPAVDRLNALNPIACARLGDELYQLVEAHWELTFVAITHAKKGAMDKAAENFTAASAMLANFSGEARQLAEVFYCARIAYYYYRSSKFTEAENCIGRILELDDQLSGAYCILHMHKIHILQNISRMLAVQNSFQEGADLLLSAMQYLVNPNHKPYPTGIWDKEHLERGVASLSITEVLESVLFLFCKDAKRFPSLGQFVVLRSGQFLYDLRKVAHDHVIYQVTMDWFEIKLALYQEGNINKFMKKTTAFLENYPDQHNHLKLSLMVDLSRTFQVLALSNESKAIYPFVASGTSPFK